MYNSWYTTYVNNVFDLIFILGIKEDQPYRGSWFYRRVSNTNNLMWRFIHCVLIWLIQGTTTKQLWG